MQIRKYSMFFQKTDILNMADVDRNIWLTMKSLGFTKVKTEASPMRYCSDTTTVDLYAETLERAQKTKLAQSMTVSQKYLIPTLAGQKTVLRAEIQFTSKSPSASRLLAEQKIVAALQGAGECDLVATPDQGWFDLSQSCAKLETILAANNPKNQGPDLPKGFESLVAAAKTGCTRDMGTGEAEHLHASDLRRTMTSRYSSAIPMEAQAMAISAISLAAYMAFSVLPNQVMASPLSAIAHTLGFLN